MRKRKIITGMLFLMPAMLLHFVLTIYPVISSFYYSLTSWDGVNTPVFVGFRNFMELYQDKSLTRSIYNTFFIAFLSIVLNNPLCLLLAIALDRQIKMRNVLRTAFYIPAIMSPVVISIIWANMLQYDGVLNSILKLIKLDFLALNWLGSMNFAIYTVIFVMIWSGTGFGAVIYLAGLQSIPTEIYESAKLDGAKGWVKFRNVTLPLIMPVVTINVFIGLVSSLKLFDIPFVLTHGGPGDASSTISLMIYKFAFEYDKKGYATAAGIVFLAIIAIITFIQVRFTRKREIEL
jgi:ABC-type sugar transport system permease subunit